MKIESKAFKSQTNCYGATAALLEQFIRRIYKNDHKVSLNNKVTMNKFMWLLVQPSSGVLCVIAESMLYFFFFLVSFHTFYLVEKTDFASEPDIPSYNTFFKRKKKYY